MITLIVSLIVLLAGGFFYSGYVARCFNVNPRRTMPAVTKRDGIDYEPLPAWRIFVIQFLNIAGTGPIFGAIMGILFGPAAYLWIVFGCLLGGAVHDFLGAMLSLRYGGASLPEIVEQTLGKRTAMVMRLFTCILLLMVVAVFVSTPASLLSSMMSDWGELGTVGFWTIVIFAYYILATLLPISALIGKIYPLFGAALLIMALGVGVGVFFSEGLEGNTWVPEVTDAFQSHHPKGLHIFPMLFITIACGAISGFHATQSPLMVRCATSEKLMRPVFYGAMITEGVVALLWAAAAIKYTGSYEGLFDQMKGNPAIIVNAICHDWMGQVGAVLAILGVVAAPVTSGDTALRSMRLMVADFLHYRQDRIANRLIVVVPLAAIVILLMNIDFNILWRYFGWGNQTLAVFTLWAVTVWLSSRGRNYLIMLLPAMFMTMVCTSFILVCPREQGGFGISEWLGFSIGAAVTIAVTATFFRKRCSGESRKLRDRAKAIREARH